MIISRTPLRISFAGGGSDLHAYYQHRPGMVVSTAIDKYIFITVNKKFDDLVRVSYSKTENVRSVDEVEHNLFREAMRIVGIERGIEIVYMGDLPSSCGGSGLGSSSAIAVGVLNSLHAFVGRPVSAQRLAEEACRIEIEILKHPIGKQDQFIAAYGGINSIQFNPDESVCVDPVICRKEVKHKLIKKLMLFYTGIERISSTILDEQKQKTPQRLPDLDRLVELAREVKKALEECRLDDFGALLHEAWLSKKKLASGVSNSRIDQYYSRALEAGARGGKILGAGGGGFLLLYCDEAHQEAVRKALAELRQIPFEFEPQGSKIIYVED